MNFIRSCLFVTIFVDKVPVKMLVDTGASVSIISEKTIKRLNLDISLISRENVDLTTEDGSFLKVIGQLQLNFKIVKNCVSQNVYVARLESGLEGILDMDFLTSSKSELSLKEECLIMNGQEIKLFRESATYCTRGQKALMVT